VRALDGTTSLIRSFPSKVSVSVPCASNPPAHIHTLACRVSQGTHTNTQPVPAKRGRSQDERGWYSNMDKFQWLLIEANARQIADLVAKRNLLRAAVKSVKAFKLRKHSLKNGKQSAKNHR
jgi:hypothetical protein